MMSVSERPRERLCSCGPAALGDHELIAILLGTGVRDRPVTRVAAEVLCVLDRNGPRTGIDDLLAIRGLGPAKATVVAAALELARRILCPGKARISLPGDVVPLVSHYSDRKQEHFLCVSLNGAHEVIATRVVSVGLVNRALVHPREVFAEPVNDRAAAVIVAHNHPSGHVEPSREDREVTERLIAAGRTLGIQVLDHIIFSTEGYYSFLENGAL
ncbi:MAG: DNA repair protein RadC [Spirochaetaceae bacterium]|nr:MAG: DNA repair protein RadC [Spirochaetaceae bacterium]